MSVITDTKKDEVYTLLPPSDPRVLSSIAPFDKDMFFTLGFYFLAFPLPFVSGFSSRFKHVF